MGYQEEGFRARDKLFNSSITWSTQISNLDNIFVIKNIVDLDENKTSKWVSYLHLFVIMEEKASSVFRGTCVF